MPWASWPWAARWARGCSICGFFALRQLGLLSLFHAWPLVTLPLLVGARLRAPVPADDTPATSGWALVALSVCVGTLLAGTPHAAPSRWWHDISNDDLFHTANAAEVRRPPPLQDPRVAGLPLNYHTFSYALPAGLRLVAGVSVGHASNLLLAGVGPALLVLLLHTVARSLATSAWARGRGRGPPRASRGSGRRDTRDSCAHLLGRASYDLAPP